MKQLPDRLHMQSSDTNLNNNLNIGSGRLPSRYFIITVLLISGMFGYGVNFLYGFSVYPDEFGYWSTAAGILGYDWGPVIGLGSYYSFGYGLLLTPILWIFKGGVAAYRAAIFLNFLLQCASVVLLYRIALWFCPDRHKDNCYIAAGIGALYPAYTYFSQTTLSEAVLTFTYILIVFLLLRYLDDPKWYRLIFLSLTLIYLYCVHMRTIGVFIVGFILILIYVIQKSSNKLTWVLIILFAVAGVLAVYYLKPLFQSKVFGYSEYLWVNDYSGQTDRISRFFDKETFIDVAINFVAKLTYLGLASYGLTYVVLIRSIRHIGSCIKRATASESKDRIRAELFIILTVFAQLAVATVYCGVSDRIDTLLYGRYSEYVLPVFICVGVVCLLNNQTVNIISFIPLLINVVTTVLIYAYINVRHIESVNPFRVPALGYVLNKHRTDGDVALLLLLAVTGIIYIAVLVITRISRNRDSLRLLFTVILLTESLLGIICNTKYTYIYSRIDQIDSRIVSWINDNTGDDSEIYYVISDEETYVNGIQFGLYDRMITVIHEGEEDVPQYGDVVITYGDNEDYPLIRTDTRHIMDTGLFKLYVIDRGTE